jgi:hypothetical protein
VFLAAAMAQAPTAAMPGVPPQMQQKQIRPELPANIQPKISQRNLLPSDVRPSVSTQTAGGQPKVRVDAKSILFAKTKFCY